MAVVSKYALPALHLVVALVLLGAGGCAGQDTAGGEAPPPADGSPAAAARADTVSTKLDFDCGKIMPKTTALLRTTKVLTRTYNEPQPGAMPASDAEWQSKNFDSYPGTACGWGVGDSAATDDGLTDHTTLDVQILPPGDWYRDHVLFLLSDEGGTAFSCSPATASGAARATWCATSETSPIYNYAADFGTALVQIKVNTDSASHPVDGAELKTAITADLAALAL